MVVVWPVFGRSMEVVLDSIGKYCNRRMQVVDKGQRALQGENPIPGMLCQIGTSNMTGIVAPTYEFSNILGRPFGGDCSGIDKGHPHLGPRAGAGL